MIHVILPSHLRTLASISGEVMLEIEGPVTARSIIETLENRYPQLQGTIRDHSTQQRRPLVRFFACGRDVSHDALDTPLPAEVAAGTESFWIVGAVAGG